MWGRLVRSAERTPRTYFLAVGVFSVLIYTGASALLASYSSSSLAIVGNRRTPPIASLSPALAQFAGSLGSSSDLGLGTFAVVELLKSDQILMGAFRRSQVALPPADVAAIADPDASNNQITLSIRSRLSVDASVRSNVIRITVRSPSPNASQHFVKAMLAEFGDHTMRLRSSQASYERTFTEERLGSASMELDRTEKQLTDFLNSNSRITDSPRLMAEKERLERRRNLAEQQFLAAAQAVEQSKLEEARRIPQLLVLQPPTRPDDREESRLPLFFAIAILGCGALPITIPRLRGIKSVPE